MPMIHDCNSADVERAEAVTVFIITPTPKTGETIAAAVRTEGYHATVFESAEAFLASIPAHRPACVVAEADMPGITGLDLHDRLMLRNDELPIVIIADSGEIAEATNAIRSGVIDYLIKPFRTSTLMDRVAEGVAMSRRALDRTKASLRLSTLTRREIKILGYLTEGCPVSEIAKTLNLSPKTIQAHRSNIMEKSETLSVVELTRLCIYAKPELVGGGGAAAPRRKHTATAQRHERGAGLVADSQSRLRLAITETRETGRVSTPS